jgi:uncharacterized LabA/DUF88 family protein
VENERNFAVLIDFDNIAKGCRQEGLGEFDIRAVMRRLKDRGRILAARAYTDWERWPRHRTALAEQGVTMVELVSHGHGDKNRGDIALVVDAMELAFTREFLDTFVILSGDSDFTPLVMRLRELNRRVIGIGTRGSTSRLIASVCDEFLYYDSIVRDVAPRPPRSEAADDEDEALDREEAFKLLVETVQNHLSDDGTAVGSGVLKTSMKRKAPTFDEAELGFRTFARFLEKAQQVGLVHLTREERGGGYRVEPAGREEEPAARPRPPERRERAQDRPPDREAAADDEPEAEVTALSPEARRLVDALAAAGMDIGAPGPRRLIAEALVEAAAERAAKNRKCAVQFVFGDMVRRNLGIRPHRIRAICNALLRAGALMHKDGTPVRSPTAPFVPPESADAVLELLDQRCLEQFAAMGESPSGEVMTEIFFGADAAAARVEYALDAVEVGEPPQPEAEAPVEPAPEAPTEEAPRKRARRGGRRTRRKTDAAEHFDLGGGD